MRPPIFVRELTEAERERLEAGLRSKDVYALRRCQILLASACEEWVPRIAAAVVPSDQQVGEWDVLVPARDAASASTVVHELLAPD